MPQTCKPIRPTLSAFSNCLFGFLGRKYNFMKHFFLSLLGLLLFFSCSKSNEDGPNDVKVTVSTSENTIYNGIETTFSANVSQDVSEVVFYFDGQNIGSDITAPYTLQYTPKDITPGTHKVTCVAKLGNNNYSGETTVTMVLRLGDEYQGGKIFYLEASGEHGLIGSTSDLSYSGEFGEEIRFSWGAETLLGTTKNNGKENTALMAANAPSSGYAGYHFKNGGYTKNGYSDWYIPSIDELEILKENKAYVGGFSNATDWQAMYWSSSESSETKAYILNFNALMGNTNDKVKVFLIRPIRKF